MGLETMTGASYIDAFNTSWPLATDNVSQADDHIRGVKNVLTQSFPGVTGAVTSTHTELNLLDGITGMQDVGAADTPTFARVETLEIRASATAGCKITDDAGAVGVIVEDGGNVGIGIANPNSDYELHVVGGATVARFERTTAPAAEIRIADSNSADAMRIGIITDQAFFKNGTATFMSAEGSDVAIGSLATPTNTLDVVGSVRIRSLPTSAGGLSAGDLWNNSGVVNVA